MKSGPCAFAEALSSLDEIERRDFDVRCVAAAYDLVDASEPYFRTRGSGGMVGRITTRSPNNAFLLLKDPMTYLEEGVKRTLSSTHTREWKSVIDLVTTVRIEIWYAVYDSLRDASSDPRKGKGQYASRFKQRNLPTSLSYSPTPDENNDPLRDIDRYFDREYDELIHIFMDKVGVHHRTLAIILTEVKALGRPWLADLMKIFDACCEHPQLIKQTEKKWTFHVEDIAAATGLSPRRVQKLVGYARRLCETLGTYDELIERMAIRPSARTASRRK